MSEEINEQNYPLVDKQAMAAGVPFQVLKAEPRDNWVTNYAYYLKQRATNGPLRPLFGRYEGEQFQVYIDGNWEDKNFWDYSEERKDPTTGEVMMGAKGKPRKQVYFDNKFDWLIKFETPVTIEYWSKEENKRVTEEHQTIWVRTSKSLSGKIQEQLDDSRVTLDNFFIIEFDRTKPPAEMYKVKFSHE